MRDQTLAVFGELVKLQCEKRQMPVGRYSNMYVPPTTSVETFQEGFSKEQANYFRQFLCKVTAL